MKTVTSVKAGTSKIESPKTPGGISKSLLTPCRRVGLSRKWRASGISPFISPLGQNNSELLNTPKSDKGEKNVENIDTTPSRPVRKKSKTFIKSLSAREPSPTIEVLESTESPESPLVLQYDSTPEQKSKIQSQIPSLDTDLKDTETCEIEPTELAENLTLTNDKIVEIAETVDTNKQDTVAKLTRRKSSKKSLKQSPNNLTKECLVVIDREMLKNNKKPKTNEIIESEIDKMPLSHISKLKAPELIIDITQDDDDFLISNKPNLNNKSSDIKKRINEPTISFNSLSDEDDDFVDTKKTIIIRKCYNKIAKPIRAKSTGSITQKDINDIKVRIEQKKELLLAKTFTEDTVELRELIKKWRRGCQDALSELMDLMKKKFPEKHNMDYSELLEMLKIPTGLVGYDSDHDCFKSPSEFNIFGY